MEISKLFALIVCGVGLDDATAGISAASFTRGFADAPRACAEPVMSHDNLAAFASVGFMHTNRFDAMRRPPSAPSVARSGCKGGLWRLSPHRLCGACPGERRGLPLARARAQGIKGRRFAMSAVLQGELQDDREFSPPEFKDTIYAQSTAVGIGGIAVLRISGPDALEALQRISKPGAKVPKPRYATLRTLIEPSTGQELDRSLVLFFPGPKSFTGEDVVEIHCHGGIAIVSSLLEALGSCEGLRIAQPGEFTKRAYLNGNMDLLEAEALNDLIHAETRGQQKQARISSVASLIMHTHSYMPKEALTQEEQGRPCSRWPARTRSSTSAGALT